MTHGPQTIAVVEDDAGVRAALADLLKSAGFRPETFPSAEAFLERRSDEPCDCVVTDVHLPGINGIALAAALAARARPIPAVLITGRADPATLALIRRAGSVPYLLKPFGDDDLLEALQRAMGP